MSQHEILRRIATIQSELGALMTLLAGGMPGGGMAETSSDAESDTGTRSEPAAPSKKQRWRYVPGTWYRIVGPNAFRNGNNFNLFEFLSKRYGNNAFSREQLGEAIETLRKAGRIDSRQAEDQIVLVFLRSAGAEKGRIAMSRPPSNEETGPVAPVEESLPPEPGEGTYRLLGDMPFRSGVNVHIWSRMGSKPFTRAKLLTIVQELVNDQAFDSIRPAETIVRDFLGRVQEKGRLARG